MIRYEYAMLALSNLVLSAILSRDHGINVATFDPKRGKDVYEAELVSLSDEIVDGVRRRDAFARDAKLLEERIESITASTSKVSKVSKFHLTMKD
jgi:hypothetical protein